jgi:hypothetical protein
MELEIDLFVSIIGVYMDSVKYFEMSGSWETLGVDLDRGVWCDTGKSESREDPGNETIGRYRGDGGTCAGTGLSHLGRYRGGEIPLRETDFPQKSIKPYGRIGRQKSQDAFCSGRNASKLSDDQRQAQTQEG